MGHSGRGRIFTSLLYPPVFNLLVLTTANERTLPATWDLGDCLDGYSRGDDGSSLPQAL